HAQPTDPEPAQQQKEATAPRLVVAALKAPVWREAPEGLVGLEGFARSFRPRPQVARVSPPPTTAVPRDAAPRHRDAAAHRARKTIAAPRPGRAWSKRRLDGRDNPPSTRVRPGGALHPPRKCD